MVEEPIGNLFFKKTQFLVKKCPFLVENPQNFTNFLFSQKMPNYINPIDLLDWIKFGVNQVTPATDVVLARTVPEEFGAASDIIRHLLPFLDAPELVRSTLMFNCLGSSQRLAAI